MKDSIKFGLMFGNGETAVSIAITQRHTQLGIAERFLEELAYEPFNLANFILWDDGVSFPVGYTG